MSILAHCDYIASRINRALRSTMKTDQFLNYCGDVKLDLHPTDGYLLSTKKTMEVLGKNGRKYKITVEEINE